MITYSLRLYVSTKICKPAACIHSLHSNNASDRLILNSQNTDSCHIFGIKVLSSCLDEVIMGSRAGVKR
jgi:hypothetical protein